MEGLERAILFGLAIKFGIPALIVGGALTYYTMEQREENRRNEKISQVFTAAGIPAEKQGVVREVLLNQGGNCGLLSSDLQKPCEIAKTNLGVRYEVPHSVVTINPK